MSVDDCPGGADGGDANDNDGDANDNEDLLVVIFGESTLLPPGSSLHNAHLQNGRRWKTASEDRRPESVKKHLQSRGSSRRVLSFHI